MKGKDYDVASEIRKIKPAPSDYTVIEVTEEAKYHHQGETSYAEPIDVFSNQEDAPPIRHSRHLLF